LGYIAHYDLYCPLPGRRMMRYMMRYMRRYMMKGKTFPRIADSFLADNPQNEPK
jgi:hypothetical protein